jgi:NAD(P)-dependent dehydrogenase (short-subunit alcohol dehydrogenase family)
LGGLDAIVYTAGMAPLGRLADTPSEVWRAVLETNVVGAVLVVRAALAELARQRGRVVALSSDSVTRPLPALVPYAASKAALETVLAGWRAECPQVAFTRMAVGPTLTGFADGWAPELAAEMFPWWQAHGYLSEALQTMAPEEVAAEVVGVLESPVGVEDVVLRPRPSDP